MGARRRVGTVLLAMVTSLAVGIAVAVPAQAAVAAFRARVLVSVACGDAYTQTSSTGVTRGVLACGSTTPQKLVFLSGNGNTWTKVATGVSGRPVAFADDGTYYFAIYEPPNARGGVVLLRRHHTTGAQVKVTLRAGAAATADDSLHSAALLVAKGRFWAAFTVNNGAILFGRTLTRQNLVPSLPSHLPDVSGWEPALARRSSTSGVVMLVAEPPPSEAGTIVRYSTRPNGTWGRVALAGSGGVSPQVAWSNGVLQQSWLQGSVSGYHVVLEDNASGTWVRRTVPGLVGNGWPVLQMFTTGGKLTFVYSGRRSGTPSSDGQVVVTQRSAGVWSTTALGVSAERNLVLGAGGWGGRTIVLFLNDGASAGRGIYSRRQA